LLPEKFSKDFEIILFFLANFEVLISFFATFFDWLKYVSWKVLNRGIEREIKLLRQRLNNLN
jgi:hypothetical protein